MSTFVTSPAAASGYTTCATEVGRSGDTSTNSGAAISVTFMWSSGAPCFCRQNQWGVFVCLFVVIFFLHHRVPCCLRLKLFSFTASSAVILLMRQISRYILRRTLVRRRPAARHFSQFPGTSCFIFHAKHPKPNLCDLESDSP